MQMIGGLPFMWESNRHDVVKTICTSKIQNIYKQVSGTINLHIKAWYGYNQMKLIYW